MIKFSDLNLDARVLKAIAEAGYETPTPIQAQAIPHALQGRDVLGIAQTGTGKTASFTLPMLTLLGKGRARARMPRSLVLAPTRELAAQVAENFETYAKHMKLSMALLIGGTSFKDQDRLIDRGVDVLIATPGRLLDHFERGKLMLTGVQIMVVDEADRMLDMGFIPDIERIFKLTPFTRQTMFYSATMAPEITRITQEFLSNPERVEVARQATTSETIQQVICKHTPSRKDRSDSEKREVLRRLIEIEGDGLTNAIVFCNRKRDVDILAKSLKKHGLDAGPIHGDLDQSIRTRTLDGFRDGDLRLLIASDVAARGLDIPAVSHVFNYDVPIHAEDYVHRIGRTGRAGRSGKAITLCLPSDEKYLAAIEDLVKMQIPVMDSPLGKGSDAAPAPTATTEEEDAPRSRTRSRSRSRRKADENTAPAENTAVDTGSDTVPEVEAKPADTAAAPAPAPREARSEARTDTAQSDGRQDNNRDSNRRSRGGSGRGGRRDDGGVKPVVGMGSHVPAFLMRELRVPNADTAPEQAPEPEQETSAVEPVAEAPKEAKPAPKRTRRSRKPAAPETQAAVADDTVEVAGDQQAKPAPESAPEPATTPVDEAESAEIAKSEAAAPTEPKSEPVTATQSAPADHVTPEPAAAAPAPAKPKPRTRARASAKSVIATATESSTDTADTTDKDDTAA